MELIEHVKAGEQTLAIIIRRPYESQRAEYGLRVLWQLS